jgi:transposase InsO family protein
VGFWNGWKIAQVFARPARLYIIVVVDKFTKWIEAKTVTTAETAAAVNFVESIIFFFGVPHSIITQNGSNFTSREFKEFCDKLGIELKFASVVHPQTKKKS